MCRSVRCCSNFGKLWSDVLQYLELCSLLSSKACRQICCETKVFWYDSVNLQTDAFLDFIYLFTLEVCGKVDCHCVHATACTGDACARSSSLMGKIVGGSQIG